MMVTIVVMMIDAVTEVNTKQKIFLSSHEM